MKKFGFIAAMMALLVCFSSCGRKEEGAKTPKIIPVKVLSAGLSDETSGRNYVGTVEESFAVSLGFSVSGTVERVMVSEGQRVNKGQLLARLNSGTLQNSYDIAASSLKQAQDAYDRLSSLHEKGSLTDIKFVEAETGLEKAKAMEAISRKNVEDSKLYAPISGVVAKRSIEEGESVMPTVSVVKLVSIDEVNIKVPIPENEIGTIKIGQPALVRVSALANKEYRGVVDKKGVEANPISHTYEIKVKFKNPESELMPGMVCKVFLQNEEPGGNIVVPNKSVQIAPDGKRFVWLTDGSTARRRFVTTGNLTDYGVVVEDGLSEGDKVIVEGYEKISEGMQISITQ